MPIDDEDLFPFPSEVAERVHDAEISDRRPPEVARYYALLAALDRLAELVMVQQPGFEPRVRTAIALRRQSLEQEDNDR